MNDQLVIDGFAGGPFLLVSAPTRGKKLPKGWTHKVCPGCGRVFAHAEYRTQSRCRTCRTTANYASGHKVRAKLWQQANRERVNAMNRAWKHANRDRWLDANRKTKYGIPHGTYARMLTEQGGGCAICAVPPPEGKSHHVDHDHVSGQVRGLLCDLCNRGLGYFRDSADRLRTAAKYLEEAHDAR